MGLSEILYDNQKIKISYPFYPAILLKFIFLLNILLLIFFSAPLRLTVSALITLGQGQGRGKGKGFFAFFAFDCLKWNKCFTKFYKNANLIAAPKFFNTKLPCLFIVHPMRFLLLR